MYAGIHVCICTCYRDEPWRCLVDVNNGEVFVIYFDFEKGVFWSVNDLSSLFCVDLYFESFWDVFLSRWPAVGWEPKYWHHSILGCLALELGYAGVTTALSVFWNFKKFLRDLIQFYRGWFHFLIGSIKFHS